MLFLASEAASYITGQTMTVDGGMMLLSPGITGHPTDVGRRNRAAIGACLRGGSRMYTEDARLQAGRPGTS